MDSQTAYRINPTCIIPASEVFFTSSRSSGKGGQHVNKVNTKVSLIFDLAASPTLTVEQKDLLKHRLGNRINKQGILRLDADRQRSRRGNQEEVIQRFLRLLRDALQPRIPRKKTKPSLKAKQKRLQGKKQRSQLKQQRTERFSGQD